MKIWLFLLALIPGLASAGAFRCAKRQCQIIKGAIHANHPLVKNEYIYWSMRLAGGTQFFQGTYEELAQVMARSIKSGPQAHKRRSGKERALTQLVRRCYGSNFEQDHGVTTFVALKPYAQILWAERNLDFKKLHQVCQSGG